MDNVIYLPPRHDATARLGDAWAGTRAEIAEHQFWIVIYGRSLAHGYMTPQYRRHIERARAGHCRDYLRLMRQAMEYERQMTIANIPFARSN